ncbi:hypothetical protein [Microbacterium sp. Se5.02b]|uniref:hypothetical protein n=1 Tax=Microbacterium sp. Se5.02b TaxID=2864103 RepID=UPI00215D8878|nr:hypothetical protein [Microbacterium sp. Se5.02b]
MITIQLMAVLAALLLSIPTRASRRAARARSRIVGRAPDEPLVLPRHAEDRATLDEEAPVGAVDDPQDEAALNDEALAPIAEPVDEEPSDPEESSPPSDDVDEPKPTTVEDDR